MYIKRMKIEGFSGFQNSGWIDFNPGVNVVIGTNNSGKSSLLAAASGKIPNNPHKRPEKYLLGHLASQRVLIDFASSQEEFLQRLASYGKSVTTAMDGPSVADAERLRQRVTLEGPIELKCEVLPGSGISNREPTFPAGLGVNNYIGKVTLAVGNLQIDPAGAGVSDTTIQAYINDSGTSIFYFPAERYHRSVTGFGRYNRLDGSAANLAGFLQFIQGNDYNKFEEITSRLRQVIPSVERITIDSIENGFQVLVWPKGSQSIRELAFTLDSCGTGVSQVLAIFSVVATRKESCIIVDEINSFLHPLAVKDLLSILSSEYHTNQYIISSHSADVVSHPSVSKLVVVERRGFDSEVKTLNRDDLVELKRVMRSLGVSMSDVLGADSVLWVEGPTETIVFPNLFRDYLEGLPRGLQVVPVSSTGDFEGSTRTKKATLKIYERFMNAALPLAQGQGFLLDREGLSDDSVLEVEASTDRKLTFLPRRCIENYVLSAAAVARLLNEASEFAQKVDELAVESALKRMARAADLRGSKFFKGDLGDEKWLKDVDGAKLLGRLFAELSENRFEFRKTLHTPILFSYVGREDLSELLQVLSERASFIAGD